MLSNAYFVAKFGFDTAENEPAKNLQNNKLLIWADAVLAVHAPRPVRRELGRLRRLAVARRADHGRRGVLAQQPLFRAWLKGSIGEGPNHSNFSHQSSVKILSKFRNFR